MARDFCKCGRTKPSRRRRCYWCSHPYGTKFPEREYEQVPVATEGTDPVRDNFEWIIAQSRGEIS